MQFKLRRKKKTNPDAEALLADANSASQHVAVLHVAFMAVCAYVLVIVFGTTDMYLLIGKGIRLPVVDVEVPIVGFYAAAPYLLVLVHLNLLLQLQLLSRKLYAFSEAIPEREGLGGLRDRLHIFPYTYYLVGRPSPTVQTLFGLLVSVTLIVLPLASLLALQIGFLAYQSEAVTWAQRIAIWLDVALIVALWPIIIHPRDDWRAYWRELFAAQWPTRLSWLAPFMLMLGLTLFLLSTAWLVLGIGLLLLALSPIASLLLYGHWPFSRQRTTGTALAVLVALASLAAGVWLDLRVLVLLGPLFLIPLATFWQTHTPRGALALLFTLYIGPLVPIAILGDGEAIENLLVHLQGNADSATQLKALVLQSTSSDTETQVIEPKNKSTLAADLFLVNQRRLDLDKQILLAKPPGPEVMANIRSDGWISAINKIEPVNLIGRSLRHAQMGHAVLMHANLSNVQLQGAQLQGAQMQGADIRGARLEGAQLQGAQMQGADLALARLEGAQLQGAQMQGADIRGARLEGAQLQGAQMQGADLTLIRLQGAQLQGSQLQGADLSLSGLEGADLRKAALYGEQPLLWTTQLVDIRGLTWTPMKTDELDTTIGMLGTIKDAARRKAAITRLNAASKPGLSKIKFLSCLAEESTPAHCTLLRIDTNDLTSKATFIHKLLSSLVKLACESPDKARGLVYQIPKFEQYYSEEMVSFLKESTRIDLKNKFETLLNDPNCPGLYELHADEKSRLHRLPPAPQ